MTKEVFVTFAAGTRTVEDLRAFLDGLFESETPAELSGERGHAIVRIPKEQWDLTDWHSLWETLRYAGFSGEFEVLSEVRSRR